MVRRMANAVALGGTLLLVGHRPIDPSTGAATAAANQVQVSVEGAVAALDAGAWELLVAEERPRAAAGTGVDAVIRARRSLDGENVMAQFDYLPPALIVAAGALGIGIELSLYPPTWDGGQK
jgi:hypothetical protein